MIIESHNYTEECSGIMLEEMIIIFRFSKRKIIEDEKNKNFIKLEIKMLQSTFSCVFKDNICIEAYLNIESETH